MKNIFAALAIGCILLAGTTAYSASIDAAVHLNGSEYLQGFNVTNNSTGGLNITRLVYSLGTPADGIATWDTATGGGVASQFLSNPEWFQTVTWSGLSIAPGASYGISWALDIDLIVTLSPLNVTGGTIDYAGTSLRNGYFGVEYNDGFGLRTVALNQTGWTTDQDLRITEAPVPIPGALLLFAPGLAGLAAVRRRFTK